MNVHFVYITASSEEEAAQIGKEMVKARLAACANIIGPIRSYYWWEGELQEDKEAVVILKTREELVGKLIHSVKAIHSYDCPCVVSLAVVEGNPDFLKWICDETTISGTGT